MPVTVPGVLASLLLLLLPVTEVEVKVPPLTVEHGHQLNLTLILLAWLPLMPLGWMGLYRRS